MVPLSLHQLILKLQLSDNIALLKEQADKSITTALNLSCSAAERLKDDIFKNSQLLMSQLRSSSTFNHAAD